MPLCDLSSGSGRLVRASNRLRERWLETKEHWHDKSCQEFESNFLQQLAPQITLTVATIQKMRELLNDAEQDCEDRDYGS